MIKIASHLGKPIKKFLMPSFNSLRPCSLGSGNLDMNQVYTPFWLKMFEDVIYIPCLQWASALPLKKCVKRTNSECFRGNCDNNMTTLIFTI